MIKKMKFLIFVFAALALESSGCGKVPNAPDVSQGVQKADAQGTKPDFSETKTEEPEVADSSESSEPFEPAPELIEVQTAGPYTCDRVPVPGSFILHVLSHRWSPNGVGEYNFGVSAGSNHNLHPLINPAVPLPINGSMPISILPLGAFAPSKGLKFVGTHNGVTGIPVAAGTAVTFSGKVEWRNHVPNIANGGNGTGDATMHIANGVSVTTLGSGVINTTATITDAGCLFFGGDQAMSDDAIRFDINRFSVNYLQ